jgi:hypothetical protein
MIGQQRRAVVPGERRASAPALDAATPFWCDAAPMKRQHRVLIGVGLLIFLAAWLAWSFLLTESELTEPAAVQQGD